MLKTKKLNTKKIKTKTKTKTTTKTKTKTKNSKHAKIQNYNKLNIVYNTHFLEKQEQRAAYRQGKGYGSSSIKKEVELCLQFIKNKPQIFIDIGAEKGTYTKAVLNYFPDIKVYMFEPSTVHKDLYKNSFTPLDI